MLPTLASGLADRAVGKSTRRLLDRLCSSGNRFPSVQLGIGKESTLRHGRRILPGDHFSQASLENAHRHCAPGTVVELRDSNKVLVAYGFLGDTLIDGVSVFELRHGRHAGDLQLVDEAYWIRKLRAALEMRKRFSVGAETNVFRACNGIADGVPGLFLDFIGGTPRIIACTAGAELLLSMAIKFCRMEGFGPHEMMFTRADSGEVSHSLLNPVDAVAHEHGLHFVTSDFHLVDARGNKATIETAQYTPFIIRPQFRTLRRLFAELAVGEVVLDLGSSAGAFAMHAIPAARRVVYCHPSSLVTSTVTRILEYQFKECCKGSSPIVSLQCSGINEHNWNVFGPVGLAVIEGGTGWIDNPSDWERVLRCVLDAMPKGGRIALVQSTTLASTFSHFSPPEKALVVAASAKQRQVHVERRFSLGSDFPLPLGEEHLSQGFALLIRVTAKGQ